MVGKEEEDRTVGRRIVGHHIVGRRIVGHHSVGRRIAALDTAEHCIAGRQFVARENNIVLVVVAPPHQYSPLAGTVVHTRRVAWECTLLVRHGVVEPLVVVMDKPRVVVVVVVVVLRAVREELVAMAHTVPFVSFVAWYERYHPVAILAGQ